MKNTMKISTYLAEVLRKSDHKLLIVNMTGRADATIGKPRYHVRKKFNEE